MNWILKNKRKPREQCFNNPWCRYCKRILTCQARDGIGLDCWEKHFKKIGDHCTYHGGGVSYWESGKLLVECSDCHGELQKNNKKYTPTIIYDKTMTKEKCGCRNNNE